MEHSRYRCFDNFMVNLLGGIAAYCFFPKNTPIFEEPLILKLLSFEFLELTLII